MRSEFFTTENLPGVALDQGLTAEELSLKYRGLTAESFFQVFICGTVGIVRGEKYDIYIVRRLAFDAPVEFDFTTIPIPHKKIFPIPTDPLKYIKDSKQDFLLQLTIDLAIQKLFQEQGCIQTMTIFNTCPFDTKLTFEDGILVKEKTTQSTDFHHAKNFGYRASDLKLLERPTDKQRELVDRPLQSELDVIVSHLAKKQGLTTTRHKDLPVAVLLDNQESILNLYLAVYDVLMEISLANLGLAAEVLETDSYVRWKKLNRYVGSGVDQSLRVRGEQIIDNLETFFKKGDIKNENIKKDTVLAEHLKNYLRAQKDYVKKQLALGTKIKLIFGPCFSNYLRLTPGNETEVHFVDAAIIRKGGNTVSGILPAEAERALSVAEKQRLMESNLMVQARLKLLFGEQFIFGHFNEEDYFSKFDKH
ncbi:MAG: hypothetical protein V1716_02910 [Candidatus Uhrbacteria bacterium]